MHVSLHHLFMEALEKVQVIQDFSYLICQGMFNYEYSIHILSGQVQYTC